MSDGLDNIDERLDNLMQQEQYAKFFANSGMSQEDIHSIVYAEGTRMIDDTISVPDEELLPIKLDETIDYEEHLTEIQIKDGVNRLKQLALKALTFMHTVDGTSMSCIFLQDAPQKEPEFHLTPKKDDDVIEK